MLNLDQLNQLTLFVIIDFYNVRNLNTQSIEGENFIFSDKLQLISFKNMEIFKKVISRIHKTKTSLIIGTYNLQDIQIEVGGLSTSLSEVLKKLARRGVKVLIILAPFMQRSQFIHTIRNNRLDSGNILIRFCRRMHFKTIISDLQYAYIGTANLSGAGVGMKSIRKRNFELGFVTYNTNVIADIATTFMEIFNGEYCSEKCCHFFENSYQKEPCFGILRNKI